MSASADNLRRLLNELGSGVCEVADQLDSEYGEGETNKSGTLRDYGTQMFQTAEHVADDGVIDWKTISEEIGIDLVDSDECECGSPIPGTHFPTRSNDDGSRAWIERCDLCSTFDNDEDAAAALVKAGAIPDYGLAKPAGSESMTPFATGGAWDMDGQTLIEEAERIVGEDRVGEESLRDFVNNYLGD